MTIRKTTSKTSTPKAGKPSLVKNTSKKKSDDDMDDDDDEEPMDDFEDDDDDDSLDLDDLDG
jgi:hypothetical protein